MTASTGTPVPVEVTDTRRARREALTFLAGPLVWSVHFGVVYLVAEAGCTGDGEGLDAFDPPVPTVVSVVATVVAVAGCALAALWAGRRRREASASGGRDRLAAAGELLAWFSLVAVLFVGLPPLFLEC